MRHGVVWLAIAAATSLVGLAAVSGLRGTAPQRTASDTARTVAPASPPSHRTAPRHASVRRSPPLGFDIVTVDRHGHLVVAGRAGAGDRVRVMADGKPLGEAVADANGEWVLTPAMPLAPGRRLLSLDTAGRDNRELRRSPRDVVINVMPSPAAVGSGDGAGPAASGSNAGGGRTWLVQRGNSLWVIAHDAYGAGPRYTAIYAANRGQIRDPDLIYPGQQFVVPKP